MNPTRCALVFCLVASSALALELPKAPEGFHWYELAEIKAGFLVPEGWHVREERDKGTLALFITESAFEPPKEFQVGMSVNVFRGDPDAAGKVKKMFDAAQAKNGVKISPGSSGPFRTLSTHFDSPPNPGEKEPVRMFMLGISNPKTGTAYLVIFESPVSRWDGAWAKGKPILDALALESSI